MPGGAADSGRIGAGPEDGLRREALRLCDRYIAEVVLAFDLCPWAESSLRAGTVARHVVTGAEPTPTDCLPVMEEWAGADGREGRTEVAVALLVIPRFAGSRAAFDRFAEGVRRADRARRAADAAPPFVMAAFHPAGASEFTGPAQLVSFLRRSPDPLLQLVRADALARVKSAAASVSDGIAARNHAALAPPGVTARFEATIRALRADRDESYRRIGVAI